MSIPLIIFGDTLSFFQFFLKDYDYESRDFFNKIKFEFIKNSLSTKSVKYLKIHAETMPLRRSVRFFMDV